MNFQTLYDLQIKSFVSPVLYRLLQAGITEVDIINMNALVTELVNNNFFLTESSPEVNINKEQQHKMNDRILCWNTLKNKLKELGNINRAIREQKEKQDKLKKQLTDTENQKKNMEMGLYKFYNLFNYIITQTHILNGSLNHIFKYLYAKNNTILQYTFLLVNLIYINSEKEDENKEKGNKDN